ncbi:MAG: 2-amino-4-hydroxy-6-hydroxymethyldihydropteridine diphosphokinase [Planctomycetota bacterium]
MRYCLAIGSNCGDRQAHIDAAATALRQDPQVDLLHMSRLHETAPVGGPPGQDPFLNGAWMVETRLGPHALLHRLQAIEHACGRARSIPWGPRSLDLDLLLAEDGRCCVSSVLVLPHPELHRRSFVLAPLVEIAADWWHPLRRCRIAACWRQLRETA